MHRYEYSLFYKNDLLIDLKMLLRERESKSFHLLLHSQMSATARAWPVLSQEQGVFPRFAKGVQGFKHLGHLHCFPRHIRKELDQKYSRGDTNWYPYEIPAL